MENKELYFIGERKVWVEGNSLVFNQDGHEIRMNGDNTITCDGKEVYHLPRKTNRERIRELSAEGLAEMLMLYDDEHYVYHTHNGDFDVDAYEEALNAEVEWLNSESESD